MKKVSGSHKTLFLLLKIMFLILKTVFQARSEYIPETCGNLLLSALRTEI